MRRRTLVLAAVLLTSLWSPVMAQASTIVPGANAAVEGNIDNGFPFNIAQFSQASQRYQQVYGSEAFGGAIWIDEIVFRPDAFEGAAFASTLSSIRIDLSTTSAAVDGLSTVFASNVGANNTTVFNGALSLSSSFTGPVGGPMAFDIVITLSTPFLYNPSFGNLLMDVRNFGGGATTQFDAEIAARDSISRVFTSTGINGPGEVDTLGLVTMFRTRDVVVPEPTTLVLLGSGVVALVVRRRRATRG